MVVDDDVVAFHVNNINYAKVVVVVVDDVVVVVVVDFVVVDDVVVVVVVDDVVAVVVVDDVVDDDAESVMSCGVMYQSHYSYFPYQRNIIDKQVNIHRYTGIFSKLYRTVLHQFFIVRVGD